MVTVIPATRRYETLKHPTSGTTHLYLVRHGQTAGNVNHLLIGHTDMPLDELGLLQARQVGQRMRSVTLDAVVSSPLQRVSVTAAEIAGHQGLDLVMDARLKEIHFGHCEGLSTAEAAKLHPEIMALDADPLDEDFCWPGGDLRSRFHTNVFAAFTDIVVAYLDKHVAVVCHGGVIGSFVAQLDGGSPNDYTAYPIANCSVTHLEVHAEGTTAHLMNDVAHLEVVSTEPFTFAMRGQESTDRSPEE